MKGPRSRECAKGSPMGEKEGESREEKKGSDAALENNLPVILLLKSSKEIILPLWLFFAAISSSAPLSFPVVKDTHASLHCFSFLKPQEGASSSE